MYFNQGEWGEDSTFRSDFSDAVSLDWETGQNDYYDLPEDPIEFETEPQTDTLVPDSFIDIQV